jgi:hypothetical protein
MFVETFSGFCWFDISLLCIYDRVDQGTHSCALQSIVKSIVITFSFMRKGVV